MFMILSEVSSRNPSVVPGVLREMPGSNPCISYQTPVGVSEGLFELLRRNP